MDGEDLTKVPDLRTVLVQDEWWHAVGTGGNVVEATSMEHFQVRGLPSSAAVVLRTVPSHEWGWALEVHALSHQPVHFQACLW